MLKGFKTFLFRGNVVDLAVAVVIGAAFGAVVTALVKDSDTTDCGVVGQPDFSALVFTVNGSKFLIGDFINAVLAFVLVAAAIYFFVVMPMNMWWSGADAAGAVPPARVRLLCAAAFVRSRSSHRPEGGRRVSLRRSHEHS